MNVSMDKWLKEAKESENAKKVGMWLTHNGVVRATPKAVVRAENGKDAENQAEKTVAGMEFGYDKEKLQQVLEEGKNLTGVYYLRAELASGKLSVGDDIMFVLIGADTRPHAVDALNKIVGEIKANCVTEKEIL
ncbi:MAG: molybdenum cofactor biosynthesis protein MoaE [Bacillota bacterium]|nr:molybdenum cofactor biosynthesis protein MoaE [Bacillota bacterium]